MIGTTALQARQDDLLRLTVMSFTPSSPVVALELRVIGFTMGSGDEIEMQKGFEVMDVNLKKKVDTHHCCENKVRLILTIAVRTRFG